MTTASGNGALGAAILDDPAALRARLAELGLFFPVADRPFVGSGSPIGSPLRAGGFELANRVSLLPPVAGDAGEEGEPSPATLERWRGYGLGGAALIWGEPIAVCESGRSHPAQLLPHPGALADLRAAVAGAREERWGERGWCLGLGLGHAGRWAVDAAGTSAPRPVRRHDALDARAGVGAEQELLSDLVLEGIGEEIIRAAHLAWNAGFDFVDLVHTGGELLHELLGAESRGGRYGGSLGARTRLLRRIIAGIAAEAPGLSIAVRLSLFDRLPGAAPVAADLAAGEEAPVPLDPAGAARPEGDAAPAASSRPGDPLEPFEVVALLRSLGVRIVAGCGGSPHYSPDLHRPGNRPSDTDTGVAEDPLVAVARHLAATRALKARFPDLLCVGAGYSALGPLLPHVAPATIERQWTDMVGLGRLANDDPTAAWSLIGAPE